MAMRNPYNYTKPQKSMVQAAPQMQKPQVVSSSPYQQNKTTDYLAQRIMAAKPEELTLMLYEGLVKFVKQGQLYIENRDIENANRVIIRSQAIVTELMETLDMSYELSQGLSSLYEFVEHQLIEANLKKDKTYLDQALVICEELKDTWKEAMKSMRA